MARRDLADVDPALLVGTDRADEDAGYVLLSAQPTRCEQPPDPADVAPLDRSALVVLDAGVAPEPLLADLASGVPGARGAHAYPALGLVEVEVADPADLPTLVVRAGTFTGVRGVVPALGNLEGARQFARSFDAMVSIAQKHAEQAGDPLYGGRAKGDEIGYPALVPDGDGWKLDSSGDDWPAPAALIPVVNFSVGTSSIHFPFVTNDVVNLATLGASRSCLVVAAAGNCGALGDGTMSAWARPDWVLAVGATDDEEGHVLAPYSARGTVDDPNSGPDVVAFGTIQTSSGPKKGTSFAAPRVSALARLVTAAFVQLGREVRVAQGAEPYGLPLIGFGVIDSFGAQIWRPTGPLVMLTALPVAGVDTGAVRTMLDELGAASESVHVRATPELARELIVGSARPMDGYAAHEVGAGFVDEPGMLDHLAAVTSWDVVRWFTPDSGSSILEPSRERLMAILVFDRTWLAGLAQLLRATGPVVALDFAKARFGMWPLGEELRTLPLDEKVSGVRMPDTTIGQT